MLKKGVFIHNVLLSNQNLHDPQGEEGVDHGNEQHHWNMLWGSDYICTNQGAKKSPKNPTKGKGWVKMGENVKVQKIARKCAKSAENEQDYLRLLRFKRGRLSGDEDRFKGGATPPFLCVRYRE